MKSQVVYCEFAQMSANSEMSGYVVTRGPLITAEKQFAATDHAWYTCCCCNNVLRDAQQLTCSNMCCKVCALRLKRDQEGFPICPCHNSRVTYEAIPNVTTLVRAIKVPCQTQPDQCGWTGCICNLQKHQSQCPRSMIKCSICSMVGERDTMMRHIRDCPEQLVTCTVCNIAPMPKKDLLQHMRTTCMQPTIPCALEHELHCNALVQPKDMANHLQDHHIQSMASVMAMQTAINDMRTYCIAMHSDLSLVKERTEELHEQLERGAGTISTNAVNINITSDKVTNLGKYLGELQGRSLNGTHLWKIDNVSQKIGGEDDPLISQPFYTSLYGYKMCCKLYLNGNGTCKGTHLTIFFVLMKSEFDDVLEFPFRFPITFSILSQSHDHKNHDVTMIPDSTLEAYVKPYQDSNPGIGSPDFGPKALLDGSPYVKNDTMYVFTKVTTDTTASKY